MTEERGERTERRKEKKPGYLEYTEHCLCACLMVIDTGELNLSSSFKWMSIEWIDIMCSLFSFKFSINPGSFHCYKAAVFSM